MLGGAGGRASEPRGRGGAGRVVSSEAECSSGPVVRNISQGAGTGAMEASTVISSTSMSSSVASGVCSVCLCGFVRHWCLVSSRVHVFAWDCVVSMCVLLGFGVWVQVGMHASVREVIVVTADKGVYNHHMAQQVSSMYAVDV